MGNQSLASVALHYGCRFSALPNRIVVYKISAVLGARSLQVKYSKSRLPTG